MYSSDSSRIHSKSKGLNCFNLIIGRASRKYRIRDFLFWNIQLDSILIDHVSLMELNLLVTHKPKILSETLSFQSKFPKLRIDNFSLNKQEKSSLISTFLSFKLGYSWRCCEFILGSQKLFYAPLIEIRRTC